MSQKLNESEMFENTLVYGPILTINLLISIPIINTLAVISIIKHISAWHDIIHP